MSLALLHCDTFLGWASASSKPLVGFFWCVGLAMAVVSYHFAEAVYLDGLRWAVFSASVSSVAILLGGGSGLWFSAPLVAGLLVLTWLVRRRVTWTRG
ncbi:MAG: hypothetical protein AAF533_00980 [Acidobacteriota bacterium]